MGQAGSKGERSTEGRAFAHYLRTGRRLSITALEPGAVETKFNPYHDPWNGRFTFAPGGMRSAGGGKVREGASRDTPPPRIVSRGDQASDAATAGSTVFPGGGQVEEAVYRPGTDVAPVQLAQVIRPPGRMGGNIRAFQDPMTLQQVFPGLGTAPAGSILALADGVFDVTGPSARLTSDLSRQYSNLLIAQIKAIDPNYRFDSFGFPETVEGQMNQLRALKQDRARAFHVIKGEIEPLQVETLRYLQGRTDAAYKEAMEKLQSGTLKVRLSSPEAVGNYVDKMVRFRLRRFYNNLGIRSGAGEKVRVNAREYDSSGSDLTYRLPDARVGDLAFDVSLTRKTSSTKQIRGFFAADFKPRAVVIIRPSQLGPDSSYIIKRPGN